MAHGLGIIGNCSYSALLKEGSVEWLCWPRPDSSFVFGPILDRERGGVFTVEGIDATEVRQEYLENTNVLRTIFRCAGGEFELIDFAPRFQLYDRYFKPQMLMRIRDRFPESPAPGFGVSPSTSTGSSRRGSGAARTTSSSRASRRPSG